jgi:Flp pilus assembly protein TadG
MTGVSLFSSLRCAARRFSGDRSGNIAILFALSLIPILTFVGAAVDYSRANAARTSMIGALDSTALMLSRDLSEGTITTADIAAKANTYFKALYNSKEAQNVTLTSSYAAGTSTGSQIELVASGEIVTQFMQIAGFPTMGFSTKTTTTWGNTRMRVAMVLDNTGSMANNGKMAAMQSAAKSMIDTLSGYNKQTGDVYISIIPFTKDVNVGTTNVNASWINWTEWEAEPKILTANSYPINVSYGGITYTWADIGPGAPCPFDNTKTGGVTPPTNSSSSSPFGFACMDRPGTTSGATNLSSLSGSSRYLIPAMKDSSGNANPYGGMICPGIDSGTKYPGKTAVYYNGCYTSVANTPTVVASGSSASCPTGTPNCSCSGSGSSRQCTKTTYSHYWRTHPTDTTQAMNSAPAHSTWTGCVNDRDQDYDTKNTAPGSSSAAPSSQFYAEQWKDCLSSPVTAMSNSWQTLKDQITAMTTGGNTNQSIGMAWGWQSLSTTNGPIAAPAKASDYIYKDYIVLLSDGMNTQNRTTTTQSVIDARQKILCQNVKGDTANPVTVFTIQVNINKGDSTSQVLKDCATSTGYFQEITATSQTAGAFQNIITEISKLRVAK